MLSVPETRENYKLQKLSILKTNPTMHRNQNHMQHQKTQTQITDSQLEFFFRWESKTFS